MFKSPGSLLSLALGRALQPHRKVKRASLRVLDPNDPYQAARIAAAMVKRERKANKRHVDMWRCMSRNNAHAEQGHPQGGYTRALNPFYINRSTTA